MIDAAALFRMIDEAPGEIIALSKDQMRTIAREIAAGNAAQMITAQARRIEAAIDGMIARPA